MPKAFIKLAYRQVLDSSCTDEFSKAILNLSYNEFKLKCQAYNPENKFKTFTALKANDGRANSLHYKSGFAIGGVIEKLERKIPGVSNCFEEAIKFTTYKFEVIESDLGDFSKHTVAVHYFTDVCTLHEIIGDKLLLSYGINTPADAGFADTFLLKIQGSLSVINYREAPFCTMEKMQDEHGLLA